MKSSDFPQMNNPFVKTHLGSKNDALKLFQRAAKEVPGYREFLKDKHYKTGMRWEGVPTSDKANYLVRHDFPKLLAPEFENTFTIFSSSGSSGHPFYWPQLRKSHIASAERLNRFLEGAFAIHKRKTLAIVGLALGSWIGGDYFSWVLKNLAIQVPYPFAVFCPGNRHEEILRMIGAAEFFVDQILLLCCPSAIGHLHLRAEQDGFKLPHSKLRYLVIGEPFPERLRSALHQKGNLQKDEIPILSIYGSADTGVLGFESPASARLRGLLHENGELAAKFGFGPMTPHFFHNAAPDSLLETLRGRLCVTRWQGIPLIRYDLHDAALLLNWKKIRAFTADFIEGRGESPSQFLSRSSGLPDLVAVTGRADSCLILCGTNLTEGMLDEAVKSQVSKGILTGAYQARIIFRNERQQIHFTIEHRRPKLSPDLESRLYLDLVEELGRVQPEFKDDWSSIYRRWDRDPDKRILQIDWVRWPGLSSKIEKQAKIRGIQQ